MVMMVSKLSKRSFNALKTAILVFDVEAAVGLFESLQVTEASTCEGKRMSG
jgi:hypothetical protein